MKILCIAGLLAFGVLVIVALLVRLVVWVVEALYKTASSELIFQLVELRHQIQFYCGARKPSAPPKESNTPKAADAFGEEKTSE